MLIAAGANLLGSGAGNRVGRAGLVVMNLAMTAYFASAWPVLPEPQVVVGGVLFAGLAVCEVLFGGVTPDSGIQNGR